MAGVLGSSRSNRQRPPVPLGYGESLYFRLQISNPRTRRFPACRTRHDVPFFARCLCCHLPACSSLKARPWLRTIPRSCAIAVASAARKTTASAATAGSAARDIPPVYAARTALAARKTTASAAASGLARTISLRTCAAAVASAARRKTASSAVAGRRSPRRPSAIARRWAANSSVERGQACLQHPAAWHRPWRDCVAR